METTKAVDADDDDDDDVKNTEKIENEGEKYPESIPPLEVFR